jgi:hypothetical protein
MPFQDFFNGNKLALSDFSQSELTDLSNICVPLYDYISADPARVRINSRPTSWNIKKSQLYICYIATKAINHPAFEKVSALNRLISGLLFLNDATDAGWDINQPVVTSETIRIQNDIEAINTIIATKTFSYLDYPLFEKHVGMKNQVEFLNNALIESTYRYRFMVTTDKASGLSSVGLNTIMRPLLSLITTTFKAAAPYTLLFQGLMLAIDDFSQPSASTIAQQRLAEYERLKIKITSETNEMVSYKARINADVYDYDFVNCEVIPYVDEGYTNPNPTPTPTPKPTPTPINNAPTNNEKYVKYFLYFLAFVVVVIIIKRATSVN